MRKALLILVLLGHGCGLVRVPSEQGPSTPELSEQEAAKLFADWLDRRRLLLPLGEVRLVRDSPISTDPTDMKRREIRMANVLWYERLAAAGDISISQRVQLTDSRNFSWDNWLALTQRGVHERLVATRTARGASQHKCPPERLTPYGFDDALCVDEGDGKLDEIVRMQSLFAGTRQYCLFMGNYTWKWTPIALETLTALGADTRAERKFMVFAGYDPFLKTWTIHDDDVDITHRTGDFAKQAKFDELVRAGYSPGVRESRRR